MKCLVIPFLALTLAAAVGSAADTEPAKEASFNATIETVKKDRLVVAVTDGVMVRAIEVPVTADTKIVRSGKTVKLSDLKKDEFLLITVGSDNVTAVKIEVIAK